jgi:cytosine permease
LYVVGSSTFGAKGGYFIPGLLMGLLQIGWFAVATFVSADFVLKGLGMESKPGTVPFLAAGTLWGLIFAMVGAHGIRYVARIALLLNAIPLFMLLFVLFQTAGGVGGYRIPPGHENVFGAVTTMVAIVAGFFATAGAAGADFGMNARNGSDVRWGGLVGVTLAAIVAGGLTLLSIAGAHGANPALAGFDYDNILQSIGGPIAAAMFFLFAIASVPPTCFCIFIAGNSFSTMIPGVPRVASSMLAALAGIVLAVSGAAANLVSFFNIVGASFGPICGAMTADYLLSGRRWAGPREGVNVAGYLAWAIGFAVGILPFLPLPPNFLPYVQPAVVYSYVTGLAVYAALAKAGLEPKIVEMASQAPAATPQATQG